MVIASIDLMDGKAVQLRQGKEKVLEGDDPRELARRFDRYGEVAIIDLDAALGQGSNQSLIQDLLKLCDARVGGGIRSVEEARKLISLGAKKVIIGSSAFENERINIPFLEALNQALSPQEIIIAIDAREETIVTRGWRHQTGINLYEAARALTPYASEFLFTCVEREGMMQGIDLVQVERLQAATPNKITVAGGVNSLEEVGQLARAGLDVQLGMALYTGRIELGEAFIESLNWREELLPVVTRDEDGQVLMLAYVSRESLQRTFETGRMTYYSRSRRALWTKGESSGNLQRLLRLRADCDRDALLATVEQTNVACHTGSYSCFGPKQFTHADLYRVIQERLENAPPGSYTARLKDDELLKAKIMEEAQEVIEAQRREDIVWEAADVLYFLTVLLARNDIGVNEVIEELYRRRRQ